eukprot:m51a1_g4209 putative pyruvate-flavodoxin oxidoreductase (1185) ;mRNA; r:54559-58934
MTSPTAKRKQEPVDGAGATAHVAYFLSDNAFIFPITPSSPMSEQAHAWSASGRLNVFGQPMLVVQMQSEAGAAGALHGAISLGAFATTYKIAGELFPCVMHVAARTIATEALSIFGDHSDVYATRSTGWSFLCSATVQECIHMAAAAHWATLKSSVPFVHFMDGFRTSHEIQKIDFPSDDDLRAFVDWELVKEHRARGLCPERPVQRGTAQNPDVFFQASEANSPYFAHVPRVVEEALAKVREVFGVSYSLFEYHGHAAAEDVFVCMGSGAEVVRAAVDHLNERRGARVGLVKAVCDPLHADVCAALSGRAGLRIVGGRYGLSSKDFSPDMVLAAFKNLVSESPRNHFTVGIVDDVSMTSLEVAEHIDTLPAGTRQCMLWGIGGDGTVGANKAAIKLIADNTALHAQGYFAYDANKAGGLTVSHLRFGPNRFEAPYLLNESDYVACHHPSYINRFDLLGTLRSGGTFVLNCPWKTIKELEDNLPKQLLRDIATKRAEFYVIDASRIAEEAGIGRYINMVLQAVFFFLSRVLDVGQALQLLKDSIKKMYLHKGPKVIEQNVSAVDKSLASEALLKVTYDASAWESLPSEETVKETKLVPERLEAFNRDVFEPVARFEGDKIPVSKMPRGGEVPTGTSQLSKRGIAEKIPHWHAEKCIQCNQCSFVCPHAVIRSYQISEPELATAPRGFESLKSRKPGFHFRINVSALDCTGCAVCAEQCPTKCLEMVPLAPEYSRTREAIGYVAGVRPKPELGDRNTVLGIGSRQPLFEFPGACGGCGETPLVRLASQLFGERMVIAAATGCGTIWGGSFPLTPYTCNERGEGPAWHNSLFEDAAELGYGMACAYRQRRELYIARVRAAVGARPAGMTEELRAALGEWLECCMSYDRSREMRDRLRPLLDAVPADADAAVLALREPHNAELLARTSFWIIGGDGWAYDIGYGGIDHVLASREDINILVMDTEVYSNTGGQRSKSTPMGAQAKFAVSGKDTHKKDLGRMAMAYETAYVASIAQGADMQQCINALKEAEAYDGPAIVVGYTPCTEHHLVRGMRDCMAVQKLAVQTGYWLLYRFNPSLVPQASPHPPSAPAPPPSRLPHFLTSSLPTGARAGQEPVRARLEAAVEAPDGVPQHAGPLCRPDARGSREGQASVAPPSRAATADHSLLPMQSCTRSWPRGSSGASCATSGW